jgi:hypothetical protein
MATSSAQDRAAKMSDQLDFCGAVRCAVAGQRCVASCMHDAHVLCGGEDLSLNLLHAVKKAMSLNLEYEILLIVMTADLQSPQGWI